MLGVCYFQQQTPAYGGYAPPGILYLDSIPKDSIIAEPVPAYQPTKTPTFQDAYRFGDPFSNHISPSPLILSDPSSISLDVAYDSGFNYTVYEKVGDVHFRPMTTMTFEEYDRYNDGEIAKDYFQERSAGLDGESAVSGRSLIPRLYISPVFDRLFGGSYVDIQPNGFVNLDFGARFQRTDNPLTPRRQQSNGGFNFDQQISLNLVGKIGEKLAVTANFDNNNTFDFQNNLKVEYTGYEEDMVKKIEIGNVSMPVSNSLMTGGQALFGVKTQLQFGKLFVTSVISRQQGQSEVITVESGFQGKTFEVQASEYDENKHFFLGHFFRDNYENWLRNLPQVVSGVNVTRVEVYVINRNNETQTTRQVVGFLDLAEGREIYRPENQYIGSGKPTAPANNGANKLFASLTANEALRDRDQVTSLLQTEFGFEESTDFVKIGTARKLDATEYTINNKMGFVSLLRKLQNDEMLAVSYEYTYNGQTYKVGELTEDYSGRSENQVIFLKMLRPNRISTSIPSWDLMMKNIYYLNASQIEKDGFTLRIQYRDDASGIDNPSLHEGRNTTNIPLLQLMGLDQLNRNNDKQQDGNFDFIEGVTIDSRNGSIIFPVLEPFGQTLRSKFEPSEVGFIEKYVYDTLYATTKANATTVASKNKYFIVGKFNSGTSSEIALPGINIAPNSVVVTAGNTPLTEGLDYTVNYSIGSVRIINEGVLNSGKTINIGYEKADLFNFQARWLYGTRAEYRFSDRFNIGGTILYLNERPGGISRYKIGDEPTRNTKYGFDIAYQEEVPLLTKIMDALPLVSTKAPSSISLNAEFAQIIPATSNIVNGEGTSYIDDFETASSEFSVGGWNDWHIGSTPQTSDKKFFPVTSDPLSANFKRAKISWYSVDASVFYSTFGFSRPANIRDEDLANNYVRPVVPQEIFKGRDRVLVQTFEPLFDIAYFPSERGQNNYNPALTRDGLLPNPKENWGGITRAIKTDVDFQKTNMQYIEFWLMDPFIEGETGRVLDGVFNTNNTTGGELVFNLGNVSEDQIPDGKHGFESGLPPDGNPAKTTQSDWGRAPSEPFLINRFENNNTVARNNQDVGLDGLKNTDEVNAFSNYLSQLNVSGDVLDEIRKDPSADDFQYFIGDEQDTKDLKILQRYKKFNGTDGNSPPPGQNSTRSNSVYPDNEDINTDNTISTLEEYFEYKVSLKPGELEIGKKHIVDRIEDDRGESWYLFRIPVYNPDKVYGNEASFNNIRFMRMYLTGFSQPVVLRMAKFQLVSSQWRKYEQALNEPGLNVIPENSYSDFTVSVVSAEDNSIGSENKSPYVSPIQRDRDNTTVFNRRINEHALQICVEDLADKDSRAVYKNTDVDLLNYGRMKMFFHGEAHNGDMVNDDEVSAFLRLGTDFVEHYYEIEIPLKITPAGVGPGQVEMIWPKENEIDIAINELLALKSERNKQNFDNQVPYYKQSQDGKYKLSVRGRPDISTVRSFMIGIRNPESTDQSPKSVCIWANELRVTDFDKTQGWAANARVSTKLADVATINASTRYTSIGFGTIQQTVQQRTRAETLQYDISANVNVDKFLLPHKTGLKVPMFVSYENITTTPQFDPLDPDTPLEASLQVFETQDERDNYRRLVEDRSTRRSINFTNVHKEKVKEDAKDHFFDVENLSVSMAYSDVITSNINTQSYIQKSSSAGLGYNYAPEGFTLEPFAKVEGMKSPYLKLIKDVNLSLLPSNLSFRTDLNRNFRKTQLYNDALTIEGIDPNFERLFTFTRTYGLKWNLTKSLSLDYSARANAVIDEPDSVIEGDINTYDEKQYILKELKNLGRMKNYDQDISATYRTPLDKLPLTDWLSADLKYSAGYSWTAGSKGQVDDSLKFFGHTIQNTRDRGVSGKVDFVKLYNKVGYLKTINTPSRKKTEEKSLVKGVLRTMMSVRAVNVTYNIREGTTVSGFVKTPFLLGMDSSWNAPGWGFLLGSQDPGIRTKAAENGWLTQSRSLTSPFQQIQTKDLGLKGTIEPGRDWKIQLDAKRTLTSNYQEIFRLDSIGNDYVSLTPSRSGSYSISFLSIKTAFAKDRPDNSNRNFDQFTENIDIIRGRQESGNNFGSYDSLSQDVLIPSFIAAYSGADATSIDLSPFPLIPLPGWRVDYSGLSKIPALAELFSSITLSHGYRSTYSINNYINSLNYRSNLTLNNDILDYPQASETNDNNSLIPVYLITQVSIVEQFAPLLGINIRTKNNISTRIDYKRERNLQLNTSNSQITETSSNDVTLDFGYTKSDFKLPFKINGRTIALENDITFRMAMTFRDTQTTQRKLEGESKVTNGQTNLQFRPAFTYKLNKQLDLTGYYEHSVTEPKVSSFKTATTAFGVQLRFSLSQ